MGTCRCGHEHSSKFCPECGLVFNSPDPTDGTEESTDDTESGGSDDESASDSTKRVPATTSTKGRGSSKEADEGVQSTGRRRTRPGPRVVRVKTAAAKTQTSVGTKRIVKKALPSGSNGRAKAPAVTQRVKTNIEMKKDREEKDKKKTGGHSMREKVANASGWRWM